MRASVASDADSLHIAGVASGFNAAITILGDSSDAVVFDSRTTSLGAGALNVTAGSVEFGAVVSTTSNATITATSGAISTTVGATAGLVANSANLFAATGISLDTTVASLTASVSQTGAIDIRETDAVTLASIIAADGSIAITAGGTITATSVVSTTDDDANDITLTATGATSDLVIGVIVAGAGTSGDVTLSAGGAIVDNANDTTTDITADALSMTAGVGVGGLDAAGVGESGGSSTTFSGSIDTRARTLNVSVDGVGLVHINEFDAVAVASITTADGPITLTAAGTITATSIMSTTDSDSNDIAITANGSSSDIVVGVIAVGTGSDGDVSLSAGRALVDDASDSTVDITGNVVALSSTAGIGEAAGFGGESLDVMADTLDLTVSAAGLIHLNEFDSVALASITTADGSITIAAGGTITATNVVSATDSDANDITLTALATTADVVIGVIVAGDGLNGDVTVNAGGAIVDDANDATIDVVADAVSFHSGMNVGQAIGSGAESLDLRVRSLSALLDGAGVVQLNEFDDVVLNSVEAASGSFSIAADGTITARQASFTSDVAGNEISLVATGWTSDIVLGAVDAGGEFGRIALNAGRAIKHDAADAVTDLTAAEISVVATSGIGEASSVGGVPGGAIESRTQSLVASVTSAGSIYWSEFDAVTLSSIYTSSGGITISSGGTMAAVSVQASDVAAATIELSTTGQDADIVVGAITTDSVNGIVRLNSGRALLDDVADSLVDIRSGELLVVAHGNVGEADVVGSTSTGAIDVAVVRMSLEVIGAGSVSLDELDELTIQRVQALDAGASFAATARGKIKVESDGIRTGGSLSLTALDSLLAGDDLLVEANVVSDFGGITLNAGDDVTIGVGRTVHGHGPVQLTLDANNADAVTGVTLNLLGSVGSDSIAADAIRITGG
ncbi:MAG TPA: hypothetical protein PLV92_12565, partial [Pirellulaceae bacterium]|nr:hypothetical protein [Pirellulaceae bacterium]